jgi:hypothetical protein
MIDNEKVTQQGKFYPPPPVPPSPSIPPPPPYPPPPTMPWNDYLWTDSFCACGERLYRFFPWTPYVGPTGWTCTRYPGVTCVRGHIEFVLTSPSESPLYKPQHKRQQDPQTPRGFNAQGQRIPVRAKGKGIRTLSFENAGRAIRILMRELGARPYCNFNRNSYLALARRNQSLDFRMVIWDVRSEPVPEFAALDGPNLFSDTRPMSRLERATAALVAIGITDYRLTFHRWLYIKIPRASFVCSFYGSDDPEEWARKDKQRHDARDLSRKIREVELKLDGHRVQRKRSR